MLILDRGETFLFATFFSFFYWFWSILETYCFVCVQEYELDGIDWTKVDFEDNDDCLALIEKVRRV